jgi:hypothetical protein
VVVMAFTVFGVTPSEQARPDPLHAVLETGLAGVIAADVVVESQLAAGAKHSAHLGQGGLLVGDRAQHQRGHHSVEGPILEGQLLGPVVEHPDGGRGTGGGPLDQTAQVWFGFGGYHLVDTGGIVVET